MAVPRHDAIVVSGVIVSRYLRNGAGLMANQLMWHKRRVAPHVASSEFLRADLRRLGVDPANRKATRAHKPRLVLRGMKVHRALATSLKYQVLPTVFFLVHPDQFVAPALLYYTH